MPFVAGRGIAGRLKRMKKSNPPERVLRRAGATGFPAHATDTQKVGALQLRGRGKPRLLLYNPQLMRLACGYNLALMKPLSVNDKPA